MVKTTIMRALAVAALTSASTVFAEPIYLSCVYDSGPPFALGTPVTFTFDESREEILPGDGSPTRSAVVTPTEISFLHQGSLNEGSVLISIDRISGRFRTTVTTMGGEVPASGICTRTKGRQF